MIRRLVLLSLVAAAAGCGPARTMHQAGLLELRTPPEWHSEELTHESRKLSLSIDGAAGKAQLVVWNFPNMRDKGDGKIIELNMTRWIGQFESQDADGLIVAQADRQINGMHVSTLDVCGRFVAETSPGSGEHVNLPDYRLMGAYVVAPDGDYVIKFWGPAATVSANASEFEAAIASLKHMDKNDRTVGDAAAGEHPAHGV